MRAAMRVSRLRLAVASLLKSLGQIFADRPGSIVLRTITCAVPGRGGERSTFSTTAPPDASERESSAPDQDRCALRGESPFHNPSRRLTGLLTAGAFAVLTAGALG